MGLQLSLLLPWSIGSGDRLQSFDVALLRDSKRLAVERAEELSFTGESATALAGFHDQYYSFCRSYPTLPARRSHYYTIYEQEEERCRRLGVKSSWRLHLEWLGVEGKEERLMDGPVSGHNDFCIFPSSLPVLVKMPIPFRCHQVCGPGVASNTYSPLAFTASSGHCMH